MAAAGRLRVLILSWRDPKNPRAGGAELFTHEMARRLVAGGDQVEWFVAGFPGGAAEDVLDGVRIVRAGKQWTVHWNAMRHYRHKLRGRFDVVVDEVNTIPFFTPVWADVPSLLLIYQLAREVWWYESRPPLSAIGYAAEPAYLRVYRTTPAMTISASTEDDLRRLGVTAPITVLPIGLEPMRIPVVSKETAPTFIYVGRMAPSKRVHDIVAAFGLFREAHDESRLWLVGDGDDAYLDRLRRQVREAGLGQAVELLGRLPADEKHERMARAHVLLMASVREGWGLSIAEAGACGTPSVVYDVPGLRDAVRNNETGLVVSPTPEAMARGMSDLLADGGRYARIAQEARRWSGTFSFDAAAAVFRATILRSLGENAPAPTPAPSPTPPPPSPGSSAR